MVCESCGKNPATVHITEIPEKKKRKEVHLCEECAREKGQAPQPSLSQVLNALSGQASQEATALSELACPKCGMTYAEFRSGGRLGCPEDYNTFKRALQPFLERIHGSTRHTGKSPSHLSRTLSADRKMTVLQREMEKSIDEEDFERAADLRDRIKELKDKQSG